MERGDTVAKIRLTGHVAALLMITMTTMTVVQAAFALYDQRAARPY
ncbi:hypothetical protein ACSHWO_38200 (plasmid) [Streptomyces sp. HUAS TT3]